MRPAAILRIGAARAAFAAGRRAAALTVLALLGAALPAAPGAAQPGAPFRDCRDCPEMMAVPAGTFLMGAPDDDGMATAYERPQHPVRIAAFAMSRAPVTRRQFASFVAASGHSTQPGCWYQPGDGHGPIAESRTRSWRAPGFRQRDDDAVVCVTHDDALAYARWLAARTGRAYRLPSEAEWEYVARTVRPGGRSGLRAARAASHDWVADCAHDSYVGAPDDGSAWMEGGPVALSLGCRFRVTRGQATPGRPPLSRSFDYPERADVWTGFRVARPLP